MTSVLEKLRTYFASARGRQTAVIAAVVVVLLVVAGYFVFSRGGDDKDSSVAAGSSTYLSLACSLNDQSLAVKASARLDGASGPHTTALLAESQLMGAAGRVDTDESSFTSFSQSLALATQGRNARTLSTLLSRIDGQCGKRTRVKATAPNEAKLTCSIRDRLAKTAPTPKKLGSPQAAPWWELRSMRFLARTAAAGQKSYRPLVAPAGQAFVAAGQPKGAKRYAAALANLKKACAKVG